MPRLLALAAAVTLIAAATLVPVSPAFGWQPRTFGTCLVCGEFGGLDAVNNILLYLPFGAAAAAAGWRFRRTFLLALGLATAVELTQFAGLTGRYPGVGDILFNVLGATAGSGLVVSRRGWMTPSPRAARAGALLAAGAFVLVTATTSWLLDLSVPDDPLISQWAPRRAVPFLGQLHGAALNGQALPPGPISGEATDRFRSLGRVGRTAIAAEITPPQDSPQGLAPIVRVVTDERVYLALGQSGDAIVFVPALRSREIGFRTIGIPATIPAAASNRVSARGVAEPRMLQVAVESPSGGSTSSRLDLTVGLMWATLLPISVPIGDWHWIASATWLLVLTIPLGFYAAAGQSARWWWLVPIALASGLWAVPAAAGIALSGWTEWAGAVTGAAAGGVAGLQCYRARFVHRAVSGTWTAELGGRTG